MPVVLLLPPLLPPWLRGLGCAEASPPLLPPPPLVLLSSSSTAAVSTCGASHGHLSSAAATGRSRASFLSAPRMNAFAATDMVTGKESSSYSTALACSSRLPPDANGDAPVSSSYASTPMAHTSTFDEYTSVRSCLFSKGLCLGGQRNTSGA
eukprot:363974-Chlamydomonas_euryale.AAC.21